MSFQSFSEVMLAKILCKRQNLIFHFICSFPHCWPFLLPQWKKLVLKLKLLISIFPENSLNLLSFLLVFKETGIFLQFTLVYMLGSSVWRSFYFGHDEKSFVGNDLPKEYV